MGDRFGPWGRGERLRAGIISGAMLAAVLSPLWQYRRPPGERSDGFPLSWYPMFSVRRRRRCWITFAVGVRSDGGRRCLPAAALGAGGINQVRRQLYRVAVREGDPQRAAARIAAGVAGRRDCCDVVRVEVVRARFDLDQCLLGKVVDGELRTLANAPVVPEVVVVAPGAGVRP